MQKLQSIIVQGNIQLKQIKSFKSSKIRILFNITINDQKKIIFAKYL